MRKITLLIGLAVLIIFSACNSAREAVRKANNDIKFTYINNYSSHFTVIENNWVQYFSEDIYVRMKQQSPNILPIYLDSYGSIYPDSAYLSSIDREAFEWGRIKKKKTIKYSLFQFMAYDKFYNGLASNSNSLPAPRRKLYQNFHRVCDSLEKKSDLDIDNFYDLWDGFRDSLAIEDIRARIKSTGAKRVLFYVHGYNVPYSLAALQSLELKKVIDSLQADDKTLLVPIFWPSNNMKEHILTPASTRRPETSVNDKKSFKNGKLFWFYHNQAFYAASGLRKLLNGLENVKASDGSELKVNLYSHSLGAVVVSSAISNTYSKMKLNNFLLQNINLKWDSLKTANNQLYNDLRESDRLGYYLMEKFNQIPTPKLKLNVFMSAPAIPGRNTFMDMTTEEMNRISIFSTSNTMDPVLNKFNTGPLHKLGITTAGNFGATNFGCDFKGAKANTEQLFAQRQVPDHLHIKDLLVLDHDFFVYLNTLPYRQHIADFLAASAPSTRASIDEPFDTLYKNLNALISGGKFKPVKENRFNHRTRIVALGNIDTYIAGQYTLNKMVKTLVESERDTLPSSEFSKEILPRTQSKIATKKDAFALVMLRRQLSESYNPGYSRFVLDKLTDAVDVQLAKVCSQSFPMYTYKTNRPQLIKFFSIRTGNDLFTPAGLTGAKGDKWYWQNNDDRDYTGSLLIEVGTDYLGSPRRRNLNTYQTLFYGFDVFTPYFKDTIIFKTDTSFNPLDRPHASFQYFGWAKYGLSRNAGYRWSFNFKYGKIGGYDAANFQNALHQDISYSPRPQGWGAQIANKGRIGFSIEGTHEWDLAFKTKYRENRFLAFRFQPLVYWKAGTYMTIAGGGLQVSNKKFSRANPNYINLRKKQFVVRWSDNLMWSWSFTGHYVQHNTMLEGYGLFETKELANDKTTPESRFVLARNRVQPFVFSNNITISYTALHFTLFYKWSSFSSETTSKEIGVYRLPGDSNKMNIDGRWHHFAVIGISFNVVKY